jgi:hypothetical protein
MGMNLRETECEDTDQWVRVGDAYPSINGSAALCWTLAAFQFLDPIHSR